MKDRPQNGLFILAIVFILVGVLLLRYTLINEGEVVDKKYDEAYSAIELTPAAGETMRPQLVHHPASWTVTISNQTKSRKCRVNKLEWEQVKIGDWFECK
ncbi:MAG: hypothetical protein COA63_008250 [Methylophaga sp.]|nr:hypothetical protein [Methylophaga sp.]